MNLFEAIKNLGSKNNSPDVKGIRVKPNPGRDNDIPVSKQGKGLVDLLSELTDSSSMVDMSQLSALRNISLDRSSLYDVYDQMKLDSTIASALELYADDATQYNRDGSIVWVESDDPNIAAFGNRLMDVLNINADAWSHIYSLALYGDVYLETFRDDPEDSTLFDPLYRNATGEFDLRTRKPGYYLQEYVEMVSNPAEIFDLVKRGKTVGYVKIPIDHRPETNNATYQASYAINNTNENDVVHDPRKYVHICLANDINRYPETVSVTFNANAAINNSIQQLHKDNDKKYSDGDFIQKKQANLSGASSELKQITYNVQRGKSILQDIYSIYQVVSLMEDSVLLNRVTRSSIIRLLQVEVGDSTKSQVSNIMKRLKQMIEQRNFMDKGQGRYKSQASPGPIDNILYIPTRNGKGEISMSNIGGDVDVRSIVDLDYFANKLYGALKIPKAFLGQDMEGTGLSNGTSLTKLDARYARTIKRIQNAYIQGITTLINLFALDKGLNSYVNNFTVKMVSPSTVEDNDRDENMSTKMDLISTFIELLGEAYSDETKKEIFEYFVSIYLGDSEICGILAKDKGPEPEDTEEGDFGDVDNGGSGGDDFDMDFNMGDESSEEPDMSSSEDNASDEGTEETGGEELDFGDFEDNY